MVAIQVIVLLTMFIFLIHCIRIFIRIIGCEIKLGRDYEVVMSSIMMLFLVALTLSMPFMIYAVIVKAYGC